MCKTIDQILATKYTPGYICWAKQGEIIEVSALTEISGVFKCTCLVWLEQVSS